MSRLEFHQFIVSSDSHGAFRSGCLIVTGLLAARFSLAFFLLIRDPDHLDANPEWVEPSSAILQVYNMAFGDFNVAEFKSAPESPLVAVLLFVLFMFVVPIVMLNALIAIMVRSYTNGKRLSACSQTF